MVASNPHRLGESSPITSRTASMRGVRGLTHLTGRPVGKFDPEGLIFAVRLYSEPVELYDLRAFDKGPLNTFKLSRDKAVPQQSLTGHTSNKAVPLDASFSPDSQFVFSGSADGGAQLRSHGPRSLGPVQPQVRDARCGLLDDLGDNVANNVQSSEVDLEN
ncbi:hypothetical protein HPB47_018926 [Ixodes persulcatus]|uniref:Uncharacterized protein n=1 Tax=Ixodes persulcatus TaxID=34615 RepID=A0AC60QJH7_IXOPE|nr:hypothetical protein HPB47_018926 [Ixodes persulcatus]